jgi:hypothetical protein
VTKNKHRVAMTALTLVGLLASFYAFQLVGCIASAHASVPTTDGAPAPIIVARGIDPNAIVAWIGAITGGLSLLLVIAFRVLQVVAPLTPTKIDDELRDMFGEILDHLRGQATTVVVSRPAAAAPGPATVINVDTPPKEPPPPGATAGGSIGLIVLLLIGGIWLQPACGSARPRAASGAVAVLDCETPAITAVLPDLVPIARAALKRLIGSDGRIDVTQLKLDASKIKTDMGRCVVDGAIAALTTPAPQPPGVAALATSDVDAVQVRAAWESVRGELGWVPAKAVP